MKKATNRLLAGVLSLAMILTNMAGIGTIASFAAEKPTVLKVHVTYADGTTPVEGMDLGIASDGGDDISLGTTDASGNAQADVTEDDSQMTGLYDLYSDSEEFTLDGDTTVLLGGSNYVIEYVEQVNDADYDGNPVEVKVTQSAPEAGGGDTPATPEITSVEVSAETISANGGNVTVTVNGAALPDTFSYKLHYDYQGTFGPVDDYTSVKSVSATGSATQKTFEVAIPASASCQNATAYAVMVGLYSWGPFVETSSKVAVEGGQSGGEQNPPAERVKTGVLNIKVVDQNGDPAEGVAFKLNPAEDYADAVNLPATGADGKISNFDVDGKYMTGSPYSFELTGNESYTYTGSDSFTINYDSKSFKDYIDKFNGSVYEGAEQTITVSKTASTEPSTSVDKRTLKVKVVDEQGAPMSGIQLGVDGYDGVVNFANTTGQDGYVSEKTDWANGDEILVVGGNYDYTPLKLTCSINNKDYKYDIEQVNGEEYSGEVTLVLKEKTASTVNNKILNIKAVDKDGNPVEGVQFEIKGDWNTISIGKKTGADGKTSYSLVNENGDYSLQPAANSGFKTASPATVKFDQDAENNTIIKSVNGSAYTGEVSIVVETAEVEATPEVTSVAVSPAEVSADGQDVTVTVKGTKLPDSIWYYVYYTADTSGFGDTDSKVSYTATQVAMTGTDTEKTFTVSIPATSTTGYTVKGWKIGVNIEGMYAKDAAKTSSIAIKAATDPDEPTEPTVDKSVINFKVVDASGNPVSDLAFDLIGETDFGDEIYLDATNEDGITSLDLKGSMYLQDTYNVELSSKSDYMLASPVSIVLSNSECKSTCPADQVESVNGEEYTGEITVTLKLKPVVTAITKFTKTQISSDGENSLVTITGDNLNNGDKVYYRLKYTYDEEGAEKSGYTEPVAAPVTVNRTGAISFTAKIPGNADYHNAKAWTIEACATADGTYVSADSSLPVVKNVEVKPIEIKDVTDKYLENGTQINLKNTQTNTFVTYTVQGGAISGVKMLENTPYQFITDGTDLYWDYDVAFGDKIGVATGSTTACKYVDGAVTDEVFDTIWIKKYGADDPEIITVDPIPVFNEDGTPAEDGHLIDISPDGGNEVTYETKDGVISGVRMIAGIQYKVSISWDEETWDSWEQSFAGHEATYYRMTAKAGSTQAVKYGTDNVVKKLKIIGIDATKTLKIAAKTKIKKNPAADAKFALVSTADETLKINLDAADADGIIAMDIKSMEIPAGTYNLVALESHVYNASGILAELSFDTELEELAETIKTVDGEDYEGVIDVQVEKKPVAIEKVTPSFTAGYCDGKVKAPTLKVYVGGKLVASGLSKSNDDFTIAKKSSKTPGKYTITVTGKGEYTGTLKATYTLKVKPTTVASVKGSKKAFTVKAKKQSSKYVTGYQVKYSRYKSMKKAKTKVIGTKYTKTTKKITKLASKKKYYVKVRTYKKINGKKYYSAWSKTKAVKTK